MLTWSSFAQTQPLASQIVQNSLNKQRISHAYLVQGARGSGKSHFARLLSMTLFCEHRSNPNPCTTCHACVRIQAGNHPDVHWIAPEGTSIKNEQIDYLRREFTFTGVESLRKIYIIEQSDTLTTHAANRLLKFLEEPHIETTAMLLTDRPDMILPTIRSRCQIIDLKPLNREHFQDLIAQQNWKDIDEAKVRLLSIVTDRIDEAKRFHEEGKIYLIQGLVLEFLRTLIERYDERYLFIHQRWLEQLKNKADIELSLKLLLLALRELLYNRIGKTAAYVMLQQSDSIVEKATYRFTEEQLIHMLTSTLQAKQRLQQHVHPTLVIEQLTLQF